MGSLSAMLGLSAWLSVSQIKHELDQSVLGTSRKLELASDMKAAILSMRFGERGILLFSNIHGEAKVAASKTLYDKSRARLATDIAGIQRLLRTTEGASLIEQAEKSMDLYARIQAQVWQLVQDGRLQEAMQMDMHQMVAPGTAATEAADKLIQRQQVWFSESISRANQGVVASRILTAILLIVTLLVGFKSGAIVLRTARDLQANTLSVSEAAKEIALSTSQVTNSGKSLAVGASQQAASLEETSASVEEISATARKNADSSSLAASIMAEVQSSVQAGNRSLAQMMQSMAEMNACSNKIANIVKSIDGIAFQTNVLALNAAVEAARAGEAGLGFSVVADEVRSLAVRCAAAAGDTTSLVQESIEKSTASASKLDEVVAAIGRITESSEKVRNLIDEVNVASKEQARGTAQIADAVTKLERVTQSSAAAAEESAAAGESLFGQVKSLNRDVDNLNAIIGQSSLN